MYAAVLNEFSLAGEIVDSLRATTDAPLDICIEAARNVAGLIGAYVGDEDFKRVEYALKNYTVNVEDCYDKKLLDQLVIRLDDIFREKEQLSYSMMQDDFDLIEVLKVFTETVRKTDYRIPLALICEHDYKWLGQLVTLFQMDQSSEVKLASLQCISALADRCGLRVSAFLIDSRLPIVLANSLPNTGPLSELQLSSLRLLTRIYAFSLSPPLDHFDHFTRSFFVKVAALSEWHPREAIDFMVNFSAVASCLSESDCVTAALEESCPSTFGSAFIEILNKDCSERRLGFLIRLTRRGNELLQAVFYSNDISVLEHVLSRELVNNESQKIRSLCLEAIEELLSQGVGARNEELSEAVGNCSLEVSDSLRKLLSLN